MSLDLRKNNPELSTEPDFSYLDPAALEQPTVKAAQRPKGRWKKILGMIVGAGLLAAKFLAKLKFLLFFLAKGKFIMTALSMVVSIAAYAWIWGWQFAVGFVALLFIHELGHYIQLRREGVNPGRMMFIPFLGAVISSKSLGGSALAEARVGLAGPVLGTLGAAAVAGLGLAFDSDLLRALAYTGFFLNLFNLIPVVPFDGGRAMAAMAPWVWVVGLALMVGLLIFSFNPILILFVLIGAGETWRRLKHRRHGEEGNRAYYDVAVRHRFGVGVTYLALIGVLVAGMSMTYVARGF